MKEGTERTDVRCGCGKRGYRSRRAARRANTENHHSLHAYRCDTGSGLWHTAVRGKNKLWGE